MNFILFTKIRKYRVIYNEFINWFFWKLAATPPISCTKPNEEYQCGSACQNTCATHGQTCPIVNIKCNDACYCVKGYARDQDGKCIPEKSDCCVKLYPKTGW